MIRKRPAFRHLLVPAFVVFFFAAPSAQAEDTCVSAQCHATILKAETVHPATDPCGSCHEAIEPTHPQKGKKTFKLSQEPPQLCYGCHDEFGKKAQVHSPVKEGACTSCHNPHASSQPHLLEQPLKELCETCHSDQTAFKNLHGPVSAGDCTACHTPHESDVKPLLLKPAETLCVGCHTDMADALKKAHVHPALEGGCTSCHNPHGSSQRKLLNAEGSELCFQCHGEVGETLQKAKVVHAPVRSEKGCASCHSPHASDNPKLLPASEKDTCLGCHKTILTKAMTVLHGPIRDGRCTVCHNPHGSPNAKLLVNEFPPDPYVPYTGKEFALCFTCHNRDIAAYPDTSFATKFRDGERNLHFLHVNNKEKGRSCRLCHALHGGTMPVLIADSMPFGKWNLPLKFVKTETGGACSPGCHKPQVYDRQQPGRKPPAPQPPPKK